MRSLALLTLVVAAVAACGPSSSGGGDDDTNPDGGGPPATCTPGAGGCYGNVHFECAADGHTRLDEMTCPQACDPALGCVACVPGSRPCDGTV